MVMKGDESIRRWRSRRGGGGMVVKGDESIKPFCHQEEEEEW